jgi:predicted permease
VRLLLAEGLGLALVGGLAGFYMAIWASDAAAALLPVSVGVPIHPDLRVVGFTLALCAVTTLIFALAPAWGAARSDIAGVIRGANRVTRRSPFRSALVVGQLALAIVLVSGAALFLRSFLAAQTFDVGFETEDRLIVTLDLRAQGYDEQRGRRFILDALDRAAGLPGVRAVTTTSMVPLGGGMWTGSFQAEGVEPPPGQDYFDTGFNTVGPAYFETLAIPLLAGRSFTRSDDSDAPAVVVVNETLAEMVWPGQDPLGKVITHDGRFRVVGVARDATYYELGETPQPQVYLPVLQVYQPQVNLVVHARGAAAALTQPIQRELRALDPGLIIRRARTLKDVFADTLGGYRVLATLVSIFGALAIVLAAVGLYGVMSYLVTQRTREFGVRVALGAQRQQVVGLVLGRGLRLALAGIAAGTLIAWMAARAVHGFLFGISPRDPVTFLAVPIALAAVAVLSAYLPARRAASIDPMLAIRHE